MNRVFLLVALGALLLIPCLVQAEHPLQFYTPKFELTQRLTEGYDATSEVTTTTERKLPGRALLLSAVLPGMGQFYAGSWITGVGFLALEAAGWTTFAYYQIQGKDKEKEFEAFADQHWDRDPYWDAVQTIADDNGWTGGSVEQADWSQLIQYLPINFTHDLPPTNTQQYYEMIGKYLSQFGFGWDDATLDVDSTQAFDGHFSHSYPYRYEDLRYESNQLLDYANIAVEVVLVNHVISALHAGFLVELHNERTVETSLNLERKLFNGEPVTMAGVKVQW
jgi:hypothetical protein